MSRITKNLVLNEINDKDIIDFLSNKKNVNEYLRNLIRKDIVEEEMGTTLINKEIDDKMKDIEINLNNNLNNKVDSKFNQKSFENMLRDIVKKELEIALTYSDTKSKKKGGK